MVPDDRAGERGGASRTIREFCAIENISITAYYELKKRGLGPDELRVPETKIVRITADAHNAWRQRMAELKQSRAAELEAERRRELASIAGRAAAASPLHASKRATSPRERQRPRLRRRRGL